MQCSKSSENASIGILVITWNHPPRLGGIEKLMGNLCQRLKRNHPLFVITSFAGSLAEKADWIFRPGRPGLISFGLYALGRAVVLLWRHPEVRILLGGSAMVTPLVLLLGKVFHRRTVVYVHGSDLVHRSFIYQNFCVRWLRHCDQVVANSRYTASLAAGKNVCSNRLSVIPPGLDSEHFSRAMGNGTKELMELQGRKVVLFVGRLIRRKGLVKFVKECLDKIVAEVPEVCFLVVGDNAQESLAHHDDVASEIRSAVRAKKLENHVRLLGWRDDSELTSIYALADVIILPALPLEGDIEGFGMVLTEAAAAGKPAVASAVGGIPDAIEDGRSGILIEPGNYPAMSAALVELLRNESMRLTMGAEARRRSREKFDWGTIAPEYEKIFSSVNAV